MSYTMVTYTVKPGREEENAQLVRAVFDELAQARPAGFRYAVLQLQETREFVHLYTDEGSPTGVQALASFQAFVAEARDRHEQPTTGTAPALIGDYRTFNDPDHLRPPVGLPGPGPARRATPKAPRPTHKPNCDARVPRRGYRRNRGPTGAVASRRASRRGPNDAIV